jgi:hypothetical protein
LCRNRNKTRGSKLKKTSTNNGKNNFKGLIMNILEQMKLNRQVLETLRQYAETAIKNNSRLELLEINETIQTIRYDNERLIGLLLERKVTVWQRLRQLF